MEYKVNVEDIESSLSYLGGQATTREIQDHILEYYCSGSIPENYTSGRTFRMTIQRKIEDYCPQSADFKPDKYDPKFIWISRGVYRLVDNSKPYDFPLPEEIETPKDFIEGATKIVSVNYYERNPDARLACIKHYGLSCFICCFNFEDTYGEAGRDFIHVHHLKPLHEITSEYKINPINDLRPVCPNCHAMLHRRKECLSIDELKEMLTSSGTRVIPRS